MPISVWHIPHQAAQLVSAAMTRRLTANYALPGASVIDLTTSVPSPLPTGFPAHLLITQWPPATGDPGAAEGPGAPDLGEHIAACAARLAPHGCLAVAVATPHLHDLLGALVAAGRAAGLTYLQHIVVVHHLPAPPGPAPSDAVVRRLPGGSTHLRVHTDLLILRRGRGAHA